MSLLASREGTPVEEKAIRRHQRNDDIGSEDGGPPPLCSGRMRVVFLLLVALFAWADAFVGLGSRGKATHHTTTRRLHNDITGLRAEPMAVLFGGLLTAGAAASWWISGSEKRDRSAKYAEWEAKERAYRDERRRLAYIEPREEWSEADLRPYDGSKDEDGPILLAVKGDVFNVGYKGRQFYGPGAEYAIMAGRDATRFLAKNSLEEESEENLNGTRTYHLIDPLAFLTVSSVPLNIAERANLEVWYFTIKNKYEKVGELEGYDPRSADL